MAKKRNGGTVLILAAIAAVLFLVSGCYQMGGGKSRYAAGSTVKKSKGPTPVYYDFRDVLIPGELKVDKEASFNVNNGYAGLLSMKGRVERDSLIKFFKTNMVKDEWKLVTLLKSSNTVILFNKENRWCVITIEDGDFSTAVKAWVSAGSETTGGKGVTIEDTGLFK